MNTCDRLQSLYLEYVNDFLTLDAFADYLFISVEEAHAIIEAGKAIHEYRVFSHRSAA